MKVFVTGVAGQLGYDVMNELAKRGYESIGSDIKELPSVIYNKKTGEKMQYIRMDITDADSVRNVLESVRPDAVIHCAAWTDVDLAEEPENLSVVRAVNALGTRNIAEECRVLDSRMIYISTDYVFDGTGMEPWKPDCKDYRPLNIYGKTKLEGELAVSELLKKYFIVRIAWVFGKSGSNFVRTMLDVGKKHDRLTVVKDQIGTPTYTPDLARLLVDMLTTDKYGYYHATNEGGYISWYDFAVEIFHQAEVMDHLEYATEHLQVVPVTTAEYGAAKAVRPFNSRLDKSKLSENGFASLPDWKDALKRYLHEIQF